MNPNPSGGGHPASPSQSEERFRLLVESVKDYAIFILDPGGHILTWNIGAERIKGYAAPEIVGKHFSVFYPPDAVESGWPAHELEVASKVGRFEDEGWRVRKDGSRFWANVVITALRDEAGVLQGFAKVTRDLTERKLSEEQARQLARSEAARSEAEAAAREKTAYLTMLAHELRNPLSPLLTTVQVLRAAGADPRVLADGLDRVERQVRQLGRLVDDLMEASRVTFGRVVITPRRLDLARLVRTVTGDQRFAFEKAGITFTAESPDTPVWVSGDEARLSQVLTNLLDNAIKYSDQGGRAGVRLATEPGWAVLTVWDTGDGIPPEVLPKLFTPFTQADRTLARARGGLGLGLSVVKGLIDLHGGEVTAASGGPGRGSEFTIRLPLVPEPAALAENPTSPPPGHPARRVLVIEDNRDAAESLKLLLELLGHQVRVAYTGPDGVRMADEWRPDVVVSDIGLPGLDGYAVARELKLRSVASTARLIAVTGYGSEEDRRRAREAGFHGLLTKPADPAALTALIGEEWPGAA